ncbi:hypothetical protein BGW36DRAFT_354675 [Talaromyces proteolyticus]|uniref:Zn(2)-C6 fungal-type domain-containing protein n=1 Tax=Talaromyces proteolyticus TaxID=1131652 RepID=A0AAD4KZZ4_9EURO|nr:uncharacterized protein BGW36DRAFT_354675 [Talaromyces proteolyticus]KAH8703246.1 hypothetical protein BGW36DRAFT_354675 [Talaromyces proteolyticus]
MPLKYRKLQKKIDAPSKATLNGLENDAAPSKRSRARKPKVRSGCMTCKIRRVKCDEGKPTCQRCSLSSCQGSASQHGTFDIRRTGETFGLKCDGYTNQSARISEPIEICKAVLLGRPLLPRRNPQSIILDPQDALYFDLFRTNLVDDLSGYCWSDFWSHVVLCESMQDTCVRESILAISALWIAVTLDSQHCRPRQLLKYQWTSGTMLNSHHATATSHFIKALSLFRNRVETEPNSLSPRLVLITSILFITFEMLQGNTKSADHLITSSINLLRGTLQLYRRETGSIRLTPFAAHSINDMEDIEQFLPFLSIMSAFTPFCASQSANIVLWDISKGLNLQETGYFSTTKLQTQWNKFYTCTAAFIGHSLEIQMQATTPTPALKTRQQAILAQLRIWKRELASRCSGGDIPTKRTLQVLRIQHLMLWICVSSCLDTTEMAFDEHENNFQILLERCAVFLHESRPRYPFTLGTSVLSALGIVIVKCRVHNIRMMAAMLLNQVSWREGAWDATLMLYGKLGVVLLEEQAQADKDPISPNHRWTWTSAECDIQNGRLIAKYMRATPDKAGQSVYTKLVMSLDNCLDVCSEIGCFVNHASDSERLHTMVSDKEYRTMQRHSKPRSC